MNKLFLAILLSMLPISELRGGMPLAISYALENNIPLANIFFIVVVANCIAVMLLFLFLDFLHEKLLRIAPYRKFFHRIIRRMQKKVTSFEEKYKTYGFIALSLYVAIPLPITGGWTGTLIAWLLGLERKKSLIAIFSGIAIAGIVVMLASLGLIKLFF